MKLWRIDDLILDTARREVTRAGKRIRLPALSFDLLRELTGAAPEPVSVENLIQRVWGGAIVGDETVTQRVKLLRQALDDKGRDPRYIESVRGRGYRLIPVPVPVAGKTGRQGFAVGLAGAVLLVLLLAVFGLRYSGSGPKPVEVAPTPLAAQDYIRRANEYLDRHQQSDNALAASLFQQALELEPANISARAGLSFALTQSVTKFNASNRTLQRSEALARQIITDVPERHEGWLALAASLDGQGSVAPAIEAYERAVQIEPGHIGARASLAYLYQVHGQLVDALRLNLELLPHAESLHYLNLQVAECLRLLGFDPAAEPWFQRADELQPDNVFAAENRAHFLLVNQRLVEAESVISNALERGVQRAELWLNLGIIQLLRDDHDGASNSFQSALQVDPENAQAQTWLMTLRAHNGELPEDEYRRQLDTLYTAVEAGDTWPTSYLYIATLQAAYGDNGPAITSVQQLYPAGLRDHRLLMLWPAFNPLLGDARFQAEIRRIEQDIARQRDEVLRADWVPRELLFAPDHWQPAPRE